MDLRHEIRTVRNISSKPEGPGVFEEILEEAREAGYRPQGPIYARVTHKRDKPYEGPVFFLDKNGMKAIITTKNRRITLYECRDLGETHIKDLISEVENN